MKMPAAQIREEIFKNGEISFARFMELALYCPETGYYEAKKDIVGRHGDFITSVSTGSLFGELLAFQFADWLKELPVVGETSASHGPLMIIEAGAHDGRLAKDILSWLQTNRRTVFDQIEYFIVEPSQARRRWQEETLASFSAKIRWAAHLSEFENRQPVSGIMFSNELLDAFPVHRYGWDGAKREWFEWGVALDGEAFNWKKIQPPTPNFQSCCPPELEKVLPDNYTIEISPAAEKWWREAAGIFKQGKLLAIDYGFTTEEMFSPSRTRGTLRAYHQHRVTDDLLSNPGDQDLTAHVNFTAIKEAGESAGLQTELFCTQPQFLTRILQKAVSEKSFTQLDAKRVRQFQTLTHPEHLGRAFRVLVQHMPKT
jgi:SAM-dependent MidA family methyltransferase